MRADAKERIRTARWVRQGGVVMLAFGGWMLMRWTTWSPYHQAVGVHIHGGPSFTLSIEAVAGILSLALGPFVFLAGHLMLNRALRAALSNPLTSDLHEDIED